MPTVSRKKKWRIRLPDILRQLPSDTEVPGLIEDVTRAALDNSLTIESIKLQAERRTEFLC